MLEVVLGQLNEKIDNEKKILASILSPSLYNENIDIHLIGELQGLEKMKVKHLVRLHNEQ